MKDAGYSIGEMKDAGYSIEEMKGASYTIEEIKVAGHSIDVKVGPHRVKAEFDQVAAAAEALGRSPHDVARAAEAEATRD